MAGTCFPASGGSSSCVREDVCVCVCVCVCCGLALFRAYVVLDFVSLDCNHSELNWALIRTNLEVDGAKLWMETAWRVLGILVCVHEVYICIYVYMYICIYVYMYIYIDIIFTCTHMCMYVWIYIYTHVYYIHIHIYVYVYVAVGMRAESLEPCACRQSSDALVTAESFFLMRSHSSNAARLRGPGACVGTIHI